jgi:4-diphosphocytidyl-2-C-methyl-D-erythritol kinase
MISFPNAKINLGLLITEKRPDNYHSIESVFIGVDWCDVLEIIPNSVDSFSLNGVEQDINERSNLVLKALDLLRIHYKIPPISVHLQKNIPMGAGLGGGSADASFMLKLLNTNFKLGLTTNELENYASQLGSDCPFFIQNKPQFVNGRGEILTTIDNNSLSNLAILLVNPTIHISTREAFEGISIQKPTHSILDILSQDMNKWKDLGLKNDFEVSIFKKHPIIADIKTKLYDSGAVYASMSGSGSTVFGIYKDEIPKIDWDKEYLTFKGKTI